MLVKLDTGFNIEVDFAISPFHKRLFAWFIDVMVMVAYVWLGNKLLNFLFSQSWSQMEWADVLFTLPLLCYHLMFEIMWNGQSLGKKAVGIKVITTEGGQPSVSQYLIRWVFRLIDFPSWILAAIVSSSLPWWSSIFLFAGIGCLIISEKTQRIGDLLAGTIVIDLRNTTSWEDTVFTELEAGYKPRYPQVMSLSDKDINTLKSVISTVTRKSDYELSRRVAERIRLRLKISDDQDSLEFLETLLKDYNYYTTR
jgi:uncharacterized RDD family membrane protein YckC